MIPEAFDRYRAASANPVLAPASIARRQQTEGSGLKKAIQQAIFAQS
jgi:hypothetical protein